MEYDRALYRVYEHVMEDLNSSSSPLSSSSSPSSSSSTPVSTQRRRRRRNRTTTTSTNTSPSTTTTNNTSTTSIILPQSTLLPYFLPACMAPVLDVLVESFYNGSLGLDLVFRLWRVISVSVCLRHLHQEEEEEEEEEEENGHAAVSAWNGGLSHWMFWRRFESGGGSGGGGRHVRLSEQEEEMIITTTNTSGGGGGSVGVGNNNEGGGLRRRTTSSEREGSSSQNSSSSSHSQEGGGTSSSLDGNQNVEDGYASSSSSASESSTLSSASSSSSSTSSTTNPTENNLPASSALAQSVARSHRHRHHHRHHHHENTPAQTQGCTQKGLYKLMHLTFLLGVCHLFVLKKLHGTYVGAGVFKNRRGFDVKRRVLLLLKKEKEEEIKTTCLEYALSTRSVEERGRYYSTYGDASSSDDENDNDDNNNNNKNNKEETTSDENKKQQDDDTTTTTTTYDPPLLGKDEILQIKILYGGECTGQCSRVHKVVLLDDDTKNDTNTNTENSDFVHHEEETATTTTTTTQPLEETATTDWEYTNSGLNHYTSTSSFSSDYHQGEQNTKTHNNNNNNNAALSSAEYWKEVDYRFSTSEALTYLDTRTLLLHNVTVVNVTLTERCLSTGFDQGSASITTKTSEVLSQIYGMDTAIINQLMYGIKTANGKEYRNGHVQNMETKERWSWKKELLKSFDDGGVVNSSSGNFVTWFFVKIGDMILAMLSFFLIMSVTALIVRVLTTSGVVVMFPLFACFRACGLPGADDRILNLSYSWIGRARNAIDRRGIHTSWHLITAHLAKIFLYYVMYEACQAAWSVVLYSKSVPAAMPVWIYAFAMIWEYFAMVFVRSVLGVYFFPRIILLYFTAFHLYFYSVPYGYYDVALIPLFLFSVQAMIYTLIALEAPAAARGAVSMECPREVYNRLSWPEWSASIPNEWTLFLPVNSRYTPLYDQEVEDVAGSNAEDASRQQNSENPENADEDEDLESNPANSENDTNVDRPSTLSLPPGSEDITTENDSLVDHETEAIPESVPGSARAGLHSRRGITQH